MIAPYVARMSIYPRYAIYYAPCSSSPLAHFGAGLLGYDVHSGRVVDFAADIVAEMPDWAELTMDPRRYGFHGTLKAPFPLAAGHSEAELIEACTCFALAPRAIPVIAPVVRTLSGFNAVVPADRNADLDRLAMDCVTTFDAFRAPMAPEDRARRNPEAMTPRQVEQLDRYGYPYVGDDFRFHMTLTSRLPAERSAAVLALLQKRLAALDLTTLPIDRIALFKQDSAASRFRVLRSFALTPEVTMALVATA